jgi:hypothetical protein
MYCPECKTEYVEGILLCADCGVALIPELPVELSNSIGDDEYEGILTNLNASDIAIIKSLLDSESIDYYIHGEFSSVFVVHSLMVSKSQVDEAKEILKDLELEHGKTNKPKEWPEE